MKSNYVGVVMVLMGASLSGGCSNHRPETVDGKTAQHGHPRAQQAIAPPTGGITYVRDEPLDNTVGNGEIQVKKPWYQSNHGVLWCAYGTGDGVCNPSRALNTVMPNCDPNTYWNLNVANVVLTENAVPFRVTKGVRKIYKLTFDE